MPNTSDLYLLTAITNLHAGSGEGDFSIVDNQVQRDPITNFPCIHASSLKGAMREIIDSGKDVTPKEVLEIFGSRVKYEKPDEDAQNPRMKQGLYQFFDAKLLVLPVRSSKGLFFRATCPSAIEQFLSDAEVFGNKLPQTIKKGLSDLAKKTVSKETPLAFEKSLIGQKIQLEDNSTTVLDSLSTELTNLIGSQIALLHDDDFTKLTKSLPVIARNQLENGISANLWYEEIVPRESRFYFHVIRPDGESLLEKELKTLKNRIQVGANATVGYGLCTLQKMPKDASTN